MKAYELKKSKMMNLYRNIWDFYVHVFLLTCAYNYFFFLIISVQCLTLHPGLFVPAVAMTFVSFWRRISLPGDSWGVFSKATACSAKRLLASARQNPLYPRGFQLDRICSVTCTVYVFSCPSSFHACVCPRKYIV